MNTAFDPDVLFPKEKYTLIRDIPLIDEHEGGDGRSGKKFNVTKEVLKKLAENCNKRVDTTGDATPYVIGHTQDHEPEARQPEILGYFARFRTGPFFNTGKQALFGDLYLKNDKLEEAKKYPRRSIELWTKRLSIDPVSALSASAPERDLGLLLFSRDEDEKPYRYSIDPNPEGLTVNPEVPMNPAVTAAQSGETASSKGLEAKVDKLAETLQSFISMFTEAMSGGEEGDDKDLLAPAEGEEGSDEEAEKKGGDEEPKPKDKKEKGKEKPVKEDAKDSEDGDSPEDYSAEACATNGNIPNLSSKKDEVKKMAREDEVEVLKFKRELASAQKELADHKLKFQALRAEKMVADWETKDHIQFPSVEDRTAEIEMMAHLDDESLLLHEKRAKKLYSRKTPDGAAVIEVQKFARTPEATQEQSMEQAQAIAAEALKYGSYEAYLKAKSSGK